MTYHGVQPARYPPISVVSNHRLWHAKFHICELNQSRINNTGKRWRVYEICTGSFPCQYSLNNVVNSLFTQNLHCAGYSKQSRKRLKVSRRMCVGSMQMTPCYVRDMNANKFQYLWGSGQLYVYHPDVLRSKSLSLPISLPTLLKDNVEVKLCSCYTKPSDLHYLSYREL